jgi:hypothetical protein
MASHIPEPFRLTPFPANVAATEKMKGSPMKTRHRLLSAEDMIGHWKYLGVKRRWGLEFYAWRSPRNPQVNYYWEVHMMRLKMLGAGSL